MKKGTNWKKTHENWSEKDPTLHIKTVTSGAASENTFSKTNFQLRKKMCPYPMLVFFGHNSISLRNNENGKILKWKTSGEREKEKRVLQSNFARNLSDIMVESKPRIHLHAFRNAFGTMFGWITVVFSFSLSLSLALHVAFRIQISHPCPRLRHVCLYKVTRAVFAL